MRARFSAGLLAAALAALGGPTVRLAACGNSTPPVVTNEGTQSDGGGSEGDAAGPGLDAGARDSGSRDAGPPPLHVLFIGNSYTFVNDLPGQVAALATSSHVAPAITTASVVTGGATLGDLWDAGTAASTIAGGSFTHVVMQEQSETPPCDPATFYRYSALFAGAAKARGATPALYETWARIDGSADYTTYPCLGGNPTKMQDALLAAYQMAATQEGATLVPVGEAWRMVIDQHPAIVLYQSDGSHPSVAGTYLAACVFYDKLTGQAVPAAAAVPAGVDPGDAAELRAAAWAAATML